MIGSANSAKYFCDALMLVLNILQDKSLQKYFVHLNWIKLRLAKQLYMCKFVMVCFDSIYYSTISDLYSGMVGTGKFGICTPARLESVLLVRHIISANESSQECRPPILMKPTKISAT